MNWLSKVTPPGVKRILGQKETPDTNLWIKCPQTGELLYKADLDKTQWVTPAGFHMRIGAELRFRYLFDEEVWTPIAAPSVSLDPLKFRDDQKYVDRLRKTTLKTGLEEAVAIAEGRIEGAKSVVLVQDFAFMGGSMGRATGEAFIKAAETALASQSALVAVTASGGARMQEGALSLMQMPRTTLLVDDLRAARLPFVVVLTDPTTGGVTASFAMLGDIHIAEPGALIGFAGRDVILKTIRQKLPDGFQTAEYLHEKGMVDMVVDRRELKSTLGRVLHMLMDHRAPTQA